MQTAVQNSFFQALCGLFRLSETTTAIPSQLREREENTEILSNIATDVASEIEPLDADWKSALKEQTWHKMNGSNDIEWSDFIPEPTTVNANPPSHLDMFLHIVKTSPHNTLSEKARAVVKGVSECAPAKLQEINNKINPFSARPDTMNQIAIASWAALALSLAVINNGHTGSSAELLNIIALTTGKGAVASSLGKVLFNKIVPDEKWRARAETIPSKTLEAYLEHASRNVRNKVVTARCQAELCRLGDLPEKDLPAAMAKLPKLYGRSVMETLIVDQKMSHIQIGRHHFPKDFLEAMSVEDQKEIAEHRTNPKQGLNLPKKPRNVSLGIEP